MLRKSLGFTALALTASLVVTGCSSSTDSSADSTTAAAATATTSTDVVCSDLTIDTDSDALPTVEGDTGSLPTLAWTGDSAPENLTVKTLTEGTGEEVTEASTVLVNYAGWQWGSDESFDSSYTASVSFALSNVITGWQCGLSGAKVGDRLEISIPAEYAYGEASDDATSSTTSVPTGDLVFVVEVLAAVADSEELNAGTADAVMEGEQTLTDRGITVSGDLGGAATISVNDGATEPTATEVIVLARGTGEAITSETVLAVQMAYSSWDASYSASSWDLGQPQIIPMSAATALTDLVGVPVGSRVVVLMAGDDSSTSMAYVLDIEEAL